MLNKKRKSHTTQFAIVNHELCHLWLIDTLEAKGLQQKKDPMGLPSYGHANAPDWLDESVATYCEIGDVEESRVDSTFNLEPLHQFLKREHPVFAQMKQQLQAMLKNSNGQQVVMTMETSDDSLFEYYQQSTWLRYFLIAQFGENVYRQVVDKIVREEDVTSFLLKKFNTENWHVIDDKFAAFVDAGIRKQQQAASD
jgi:CO dehydrogenase/acetyl-CoA synthase beta subunit